MIEKVLSRRLTAPSLLALACLLLALPLTAQSESQPIQVDPSEEIGEEQGTEMLGVLADQPADDGREWLIDEADGRRYTVERLEKRTGAYRFLSENVIRIAGGAHLEVVDEDDEALWVKTYEAFTKVRPRPPKPPSGPTEEELAAAAATYVPQTEPSDRLKLESFDRGLPRRGQWRNGFDLADMNGDGHMDIVFGPSRKGRPLPNIFLGDSAGNWKSWSAARFTPGPYDYGDVAADDFNGDGHQDLAFGIHLRGLYLVVGDGKGGFTPWNEGIAFDVPGQGGDATSFSSRAIESIDWDEDGKPDLLALGEGPKGRKSKGKMVTGELINTSRGFLVYLNQGDGTWKPRGLETVPTTQANFADDFAVGDVNGDGQEDLITGTRRMGSRNVLAVRDDLGGIAYQALEVLRPKAFVDAVEAVDLDGDGRDDLVIGYRNRELEVWRSGIDVYLQKEDGWQRQALFSIENRQGVFSIASGDLDGDDALDLIAVTGEAKTHVFLGKGDGTFSAEASPELAGLEAQGCKAFDLELTDFDGDGKDEVVAAFAGEQVGFPGLVRLNKPGCPGQGSLRVWKPVPVKN